jgi:pimeloyl-ACP methyl ester carboxylesterase
MSVPASTDGPQDQPHRRLVDGLPLIQRRVDLAGVSTPVSYGGSGPPFLLLHGLGGFKEEWACVVPELIQTNTVIVPDLPGAGESRVEPAWIDAEAIVTWAREAIAELCDEAPVVVGHSLGGSITARLAVAHPDQVERVVLVDAASIGRPNRPSPAAFVALMRFGLRPTRKRHDGFMRRVMFDPRQAEAAWGADRWQAFEDYDIELARSKQVGAVATRLLRRVALPRIPVGRLAGIEVPVSLIWGSHDRIMRTKIATAAASRFGWPLSVIERCGHGPHIERPREFVAALKASIETS